MNRTATRKRVETLVRLILITDAVFRGPGMKARFSNVTSCNCVRHPRHPPSSSSEKNAHKQKQKSFNSYTENFWQSWVFSKAAAVGHDAVFPPRDENRGGNIWRRSSEPTYSEKHRQEAGVAAMFLQVGGYFPRNISKKEKTLCFLRQKHPSV